MQKRQYESVNIHELHSYVTLQIEIALLIVQLQQLINRPPFDPKIACLQTVIYLSNDLKCFKIVSMFRYPV